MRIIPAIDLYNGACVRLQQGDFNRVTVYNPSPIQQAIHFAEQGAHELHLVDLNGAKDGLFKHSHLIKTIKQKTSLVIQAGGGLRTESAIRSLLNQGVDRVVLGSLAVTEATLIKILMNEYGAHRFVLAFDVVLTSEPQVAIQGWQQTSAYSLWDCLQRYETFTDLLILCTDISRDGVFKGPNVTLYQQCLQTFPQFKFQASGGVSAMDDLITLKQCGLTSVIVGKALYENRLSIKTILQELTPC